jgi:hypothetical protein
VLIPKEGLDPFLQLALGSQSQHLALVPFFETGPRVVKFSAELACFLVLNEFIGLFQLHHILFNDR